MASSKRRLDRSPDRRRRDMTALDELVDAFIHHHRAMGSAVSTIKHYEDSLSLLTRCVAEEGLPLDASSLTGATMNRFAGWLRATPTRPWRGKTERSIWGVHGALKDTRIWLRWLVENELLERAPKVPVPKLPKTLFPILSDDDLELVFACKQLSERSEIATRNRALIAFMLDTAVRLGEIARLSYEDIHLRDGSARIQGKGNKERMVYFSEGCAETIMKWLTIRGEESGSLFWLEVSGINMLFKRIKTETGLPLFTAHQIRHTALTMLVRDGVDLHTIKRLAGHASVTTTEAYLAMAPTDIRDKHRAASPFDKIHQRSQPSSRGKRRLRSA